MPTYLLLLLLTCLVPTISSAEINGTETKPMCQSKCGGITIPYPFGIGRNCSIDSWADVYCNTTFNPPKPLIVGQHEVVEILQSEVRVKTNVATSCYDQSGALISRISSSINFEGTPYTLSSTKNTVTVLGCGTIVETSGPSEYLGGCFTLCNNREAIVDGKCLGAGCCQTALPTRVKEFHALAASINSYTNVSAFGTCGSAFLVEQDMYTFKFSDIVNATSLSDLPIVLNFAIGGNQTCKEAQLDSTAFQCKNNSYCQDSVDGVGYLCICNESYSGNPYLDQGCKVRRSNQTCKEAQNTTTFACKDNSYCSDSSNGTQYLCYCIDGYIGNPYINGGCKDAEISQNGQGTGTARSKWTTIILIVIPSVVVCASIVFFLWWCLRKKETVNSEKMELFLKGQGDLAPKRYKYSDIKKMTESFKYQIGKGGFGTVYKGKLPNGKFAAVKILSEEKGKGNDFINEIASISGTSHVNVVTLLGFCCEGCKIALVYEFVANGSLEKFIYTKDTTEAQPHLGWKTLYDIAIGIARGLEYLHQGMNVRILHFDIKPHNILLEEDFTPKISDFGLAKQFIGKESNILMTRARGTIGYIAPELEKESEISYKADVYSYGMMVLEMVGGRKNLDADLGASNFSKIYFPEWIYKRVDLIDDIGLHAFTSDVEEEIAKKMIFVGLWCIQKDPLDRPSMRKVLEMFEGTLDALQIPSSPFVSTPPVK